MEKRRVVITGLGTVNPLGNNVADSWAAARAGKCGIGPITQFDTNTKSTNKAAVRFLEKLGANFKQQFDENTYREFFQKMGYTDVTYHIVEGRMACDIAVIEIPETK